MSSTTSTVTKHSWSREETTLVIRAFLEGKSIKEAHCLVPEIEITSVKNKYNSCVFLDKNTRFKNVTKMHLDVWDELKDALTVPDVEAEATVEEEGSRGYWSDEPEEDDETYFKCTGTCGRVCHYEDTDGEGMCGKCQYESQKKNKNQKK
jgi:hypothetical protein